FSPSPTLLLSSTIVGRGFLKNFLRQWVLCDGRGSLHFKAPPPSRRGVGRRRRRAPHSSSLGHEPSSSWKPDASPQRGQSPSIPSSTHRACSASSCTSSRFASGSSSCRISAPF